MSLIRRDILSYNVKHINLVQFLITKPVKQIHLLWITSINTRFSMELKSYCGKLTVMHRIRHYLLVVTQITGLCPQPIQQGFREHTCTCLFLCSTGKELELVSFLEFLPRDKIIKFSSSLLLNSIQVIKIKLN